MGSQALQTGLPPILLIYGPTASGKSALAVDLAHHFGGEIINTDSMQVYRRLPILTAQPSLVDQDGIPHHLYGHLDASQNYSVGLWLEEALGVIKTVRANGKVPILVGGTGLYFEALTRGLAKIPPVGEAANAAALSLLKNKGMEALRAEVRRIDPEAAARILGADRQRLLRALSVYLETGQSLSAFQKNTKPVLTPGSWCAMTLYPEREKLYARIAARFDEMLDLGALEEARAIAARDLPDTLPVMKALGLNALIGHINGQTTLEHAKVTAVRDTRRYAKRQFTWAGGRFSHWPMIKTNERAAQQDKALRIIENDKSTRR
jgi:tRNA dimethylallyltransferase